MGLTVNHTSPSSLVVTTYIINCWQLPAERYVNCQGFYDMRWPGKLMKQIHFITLPQINETHHFIILPGLFHNFARIHFIILPESISYDYLRIMLYLEFDGINFQKYDILIASISIFGLQLCHIMASNANKYKYKDHRTLALRRFNQERQHQ